jgi:hypothetical protein
MVQLFQARNGMKALKTTNICAKECKNWDKSARSGLRAKCGAVPPVAIATDGGKRRHVDGEQPRESSANLYTINLP